MNKNAKRLMTWAASLLVLGTAAFGQTRLTADIPFAFETTVGTLPAGNYRFTNATARAGTPWMIAYNTKTGASSSMGIPMRDAHHAAGDLGPVVEFVCGPGACRLKAIRTRDDALVYSVPRSRKNTQVATVTVPLRLAHGD